MSLSQSFCLQQFCSPFSAFIGNRAIVFQPIFQGVCQLNYSQQSKAIVSLKNNRIEIDDCVEYHKVDGCSPPTSNKSIKSQNQNHKEFDTMDCFSPESFFVVVIQTILTGIK